MNNNDFTAKNSYLTNSVRHGAEFEIAHKSFTHPDYEPDGLWVASAEPTDKVGYYTMVLIDLTVDVIRGMVSDMTPSHVLVEFSTDAHDFMTESWIPLPVLFECLGIYHNFKDYDDLSAARAAEMIKSKVLAPPRLCTNRRNTVMTKKCGHLVTA